MIDSKMIKLIFENIKVERKRVPTKCLQAHSTFRSYVETPDIFMIKHMTTGMEQKQTNGTHPTASERYLLNKQILKEKTFILGVKSKASLP